MPVLEFEDGFRLGVASSATQIEGGDRNNSWYAWYQGGHIKDGADPSVATRHWEFFREDADLMRAMGIKTYRFGLEWARLEPEDGVFDEKSFKHYEDELIYLKGLGIRPLVTLHHFTNPLWFEKIGAFENKKCVDIFLRYVRAVVERLGRYIDEYITINEPNVYAVNGYFFGEWPPGAKSMKRAVLVMDNLCLCHVASYKLIHALRERMGFAGTQVGFAHHMRVFEAAPPAYPWRKWAANKVELYFQRAVAVAFTTGEKCGPLKGAGAKGRYCDFHGLNYYTRSSVKGLKDGVRANAPVNDLGWEIYPEGIARCAKELYNIEKLPVWVTENGTCDNTDAFRARYIYAHLKALKESGLPVERYYHWCFNDNFEWLEGNSARFGLVETDYKTFERRVKKSGEFYSKMIERHGVTEKMYDAYCRSEYPKNRN